MNNTTFFNTTKPSQYQINEDYMAPDSSAHQLQSPLAESAASAVSWGAILAGAMAAAALALILLLLGVGLGLSSTSPWSYSGISVSALSVTAILWLSFTQIVAYGTGGYLAGRLRSRWQATHSDEIYFRDTAHGFLTWAVASVATAVLLSSVIGSIINIGTQSVPSSANVTTNEMSIDLSSPANLVANSMSYFVSTLLRKDTLANTNSTSAITENLPANTISNINTDQNINTEISLIFMNSIRRGELPSADVNYIAQQIVERTGISSIEAEKRVTDTYSKLQTKIRNAEITAKEALNTARKGSAYAALWLFISLLIGAFVASWAATCGGRSRDL